jgi:pimeloyl-ACP methyl ester carboxylesterase
VEYTTIIDRLVNPVAYGGKSEDAFHVVIPSLPGFGFSENVKTRGWNRFRTAKAWRELMKHLGYTHYIAAGNDLGSNVSPEVGRLDPEHVLGVHVTQIFSFPSGDPLEFEELSPEEKRPWKFSRISLKTSVLILKFMPPNPGTSVMHWLILQSVFWPGTAIF